MSNETGLTNRKVIVNEIINNAVELPLEGQKLILMVAKSMKYTRDNMIRQKEKEEQYKC